MLKPTLPSVGRFKKLSDLVIHDFDAARFRVADPTAKIVEKEMIRLRKYADETLLFQ